MLEIWLKVDHFLTQISASREKINQSRHLKVKMILTLPPLRKTIPEVTLKSVYPVPEGKC